MSELFQTLPRKEDLPDYYAVVHKPIALDTMRRKLQQHRYRSVDQLAEDVNLMYLNAQHYNEARVGGGCGWLAWAGGLGGWVIGWTGWVGDWVAG